MTQHSETAEQPEATPQTVHGVNRNKVQEILENGCQLLSDSRSQSLYKLLYNLKAEKRVKIGFNEALKAVKNGTSLLVVIATDASPFAIVVPLPIECERRGVQCVAVSSKTALGKACGIYSDAIACAIVQDKRDNSSAVLNQIKAALK